MMKQEYIVKSDRYGHNHKFVLVNEELSWYSFKPEEEWMPLYVTYGDNERKTVKFIDTECGPNIYVGWTNDEVVVEEIFFIGNFMYFKLREV